MAFTRFRSHALKVQPDEQPQLHKWTRHKYDLKSDIFIPLTSTPCHYLHSYYTSNNSLRSTVKHAFTEAVTSVLPSDIHIGSTPPSVLNSSLGDYQCNSHAVICRAQEEWRRDIFQLLGRLPSYGERTTKMFCLPLLVVGPGFINATFSTSHLAQQLAHAQYPR